MKHPSTVLVALTASIAVFAALFWWNPPAPRYYPMERQWRMPDSPAATPAMGWYGRTAAALISAAATGAVVIAAGALHRRPMSLRPATIHALTILAIAVLVLATVGIVIEQYEWFEKTPSPPVRDYEY